MYSSPSQHSIGLYLFFFLILLGLALIPRQYGSGGEKKPCSRKQAEFCAEQLELMASFQRRRYWMETGLAAKQAAWLTAKAEYASGKAKCLGKGNSAEDKKICLLLENTYRLLLQAIPQSHLGRPDMVEETGVRRRAFYSEIDQSLRSYSLRIPTAYTPDTAWPLIIAIQCGEQPARTFPGIFCLTLSERATPAYTELDVFQGLQEIQQEYNIDSERIYLTGNAPLCFAIASHYADRFAGILPVADGMNATTENPAEVFAENLGNLPIFLLAGNSTATLLPEFSRNIAEKLRKSGGRIEYREFPQEKPGDELMQFILEEGLAWLCGWQRNSLPKRVTWKADLLKYGAAYWLRMEQREVPNQKAEISAEILPNNRIVIATKNLLALSLFRNRRLLAPEKPVFIELDGERVILPPQRKSPDAWITLRRDPIHGWDLEEHLPVPELAKRSDFEGPVREIFQTPFLLIAGTSSENPEMNQAWFQVARRFAQEWKRIHGVPCLAVKDTDCTTSMLAGRNLLLLGASSDNKISRLFAEAIPLYELMAPLRAQGVDLNAQDIGYQVIFPANHLENQRLFVMLGANAPNGALNHCKHLERYIATPSAPSSDFMVFDEKSTLLSEWFTTGWNLSGNGMN